MTLDFEWFQTGAIPSEAISGTYNTTLVLLSYIIAVLASYVALDFVGRLRAENRATTKLYWLMGGAFAMGAGIWSMHFIGMLAFVMPMAMGYELLWTSLSLLLAIITSGFALFVLRSEGLSYKYIALGGVLIGLAIASMHYTGMEGMRDHVTIRYKPGLFFLSIAIAILASEAALWLALESNKGSSKRQLYFKLISASVMGIAICGMHYTGMAAAVFTPTSSSHAMHLESIQPTLLAFFIAGITGLIISLALTVSTYYKKLIQLVQNEKEFLKTMLDNLEDGIIACDDQGKITVFNNALQKYLNEPAQSDKPIKLSDFFELYASNSESPLTNDKSPLNLALQGHTIRGMELLIKFKEGICRNMMADGQSIINANGKKLGAVIALHDITELKKTEQMKREFVSVVSHELRTPLTSIRGSLGLILGGTVGEFSEKAKKLLDIANKNCDRLLLLINDILDMEKIQAGKMDFKLSSIDLTHLIQEAITANKMYGQKYQVDIQLVDALPDSYVYADPDRLMQVLANLISNAVKFSPHGSTVTLSMSRMDNKIRVSVTDQGSGIPKEFQSRLFQKFSQADSSSTRGKSGTGLGLNICKLIMDKLGGTINFVSEKQGGTTFYFELESVEKPIEILPISLDSLPNQMINQRFLICEDDEAQAKYLALLLERAGFETDMAYTVSQAKKLLTQHKYHAILLDLILPDQDGISFIRDLRDNETTRDIPIIVLSVMAQEGHSILNGDVISVIDWLDKPINFKKLMEAISRIEGSNHHVMSRILHIEDDEDAQHVVASILENKVEVISVKSLKDAKSTLSQHQFDAVILDLRLPDGSGIDILPLLAHYKIPVIVYSATELDQDYSNFVVDALVKSKITNEELLAKIKRLF
jgi:NO-binding membrane sensor protein with MHYT domain/signal transduction histidine kinase/DNA-binding response OmpR family regulator